MGIDQLPLTALDRNPPPVLIDRARLESLIADAIAVLDALDGDADNEDDDPREDDDSNHCLAHDDGMGPIFREGRIFWGSQEDELGN